MIFTERNITIRNDSATINAPVILYRGDKNVEVRFILIESPYKYSNRDSINIFESTDASYAQLVIKTPNDREPIFGDITAVGNNNVTFVIRHDMIDEIEEVGKYDFQIRLFDADQTSMATTPEVVGGFIIKEPIAKEDSNNNITNSAIVGSAVVTNDLEIPTFVGSSYNKTAWHDGDVISKQKLNKMEDGIYETYELSKDNSSKIKQKADKNTTDDIQQQVNNLVLGAVGDGNNPEVVQARGSYSTLNDRHEATEKRLENIVPTQNVYVDGDVKFDGRSKVFERPFDGSATNNRYWNFQEWVGNISVQSGQFLKLYLKGYLANISGKKDKLQFQINWYKNDGTTSSATTTYAEVKFNNIVIIKVPEGDTKIAKVTIYETLTEANGTEFTDKLHVDAFLLYTGDFEFNKEFFPELKKIEETSTIVEEISHELSGTTNIATDIIKTNTNSLSFIQGNAIGNNVDSSTVNVRTDLIPIDFAKAIITCPYGYVVKCLRYGKDKQYLRFGGDPKGVYEFIPAEDEYYFKAVVALSNKTDIVANTFDGSCIKFERYSTTDTKAKVNELPRFGNAMYYQDRLTNNKGGYWIWKKDAETNTSHYYCEERIADTLSVPGVPSIFITDTHWRTTSPSKFSWDLCGLFADRIHCNNVVMGGDVLTQHATASEGKSQLINEMSNFINRCGTSLKYVFGNHDLNVANVGKTGFTDPVETYRMSYEDVYKTCIAHLDGLVNFDYSEVIYTNTEKWYRNRLHYYYDDEKNRIRYIIMDSGTSRDALSAGGTPTRLKYQYNWLAKVLEETPIGYHVMVFAHQFWADKVDAEGNKTILSTAQGDNVSKILNAYQNRQTISGTDGEITYNYDFTQSNGCPIIAMVSGHVHFDYTGAINGIPQIVTTCDAIDHTSHWGVEMTVGTVTEHAFDIIKVDKFTRTVRCFRVGAGEDRIFTY